MSKLNLSPDIVLIDEHLVRRVLPEEQGTLPLILMLHGWTGDENSMWVFANRLPRRALILAPRGFYNSPLGGYSWCSDCEVMSISLADLKPSVEGLRHLVSKIDFPSVRISSIHLMGFSQGASLALTWLYLYPKEIASMVSLSGRIPQGITFKPDDPELKGKPVFWGHGWKDDLVPVEFARIGVRQLKIAGAKIIYCEDAVGHKLSASCFRGLEAHYQNLGV